MASASALKARPISALVGPLRAHVVRAELPVVTAASMAAATPPVGQGQAQAAGKAAPVVFDLSKPPTIEGFTPLSRPKEEGFKDKFIRKTKENPFVPLGCLGTAGALTYGLIAFKHGKTRQSQMLMRTRIFAQGFTVVAIVVGVAATTLNPKQ